MRLPRDLAGADLARALCKHYGYRQVNQEGSHIILQVETPRHHRLAVPTIAPFVSGL
jgi:predicted RNA binding protein YcfA (HicA-like mRNA interferase family)